MNKYFRREEGITLLELLVVMIIISILLALLGRSFLPQIFRAENTVAQDRAKIVYEGITTCASENDGLAGNFAYIDGKYCFDNKPVENKVDVVQLSTAGGDGECWDNRLETTSTSTLALSQGLTQTPETDNKDAYVCTWGATSGTASSGPSTQENSTNARYFRVSITDNRKTYFFVRSENGFFRCSVPLQDDLGQVDDPLRCR